MLPHHAVHAVHVDHAVHMFHCKYSAEDIFVNFTSLNNEYIKYQIVIICDNSLILVFLLHVL